MAYFFLLCFFISCLGLIIALVKPATITSKLNLKPSRLKLAGMMGILILVFFVLTGVTASPKVASDKQINQPEIKGAETTVSPSITPLTASPQAAASPSLTPPPTATPTSQPSPTPKLTPKPSPVVKSPTPKPTSTPLPSPVIVPPITPQPPVSDTGDKDCGDFSSHAEAQAYFNAKGGSPSNNVDDLDRDHDGIACESLH